MLTIVDENLSLVDLRFFCLASISFGANVIKLLVPVIYKPRLMFVGKAGSLPYGGAQ